MLAWTGPRLPSPYFDFSDLSKPPGQDDRQRYLVAGNIANTESTQMPDGNACFLRIRLLTLFAITGLIAVAVLGFQNWLDDRPIQWLSYTRTTLSQHVDDDRPIVIFVSADWDMNSIVVKKIAFDNPTLKRTFRRRAVVGYYADLTSSTPESVALLQRLGRHSTPTVAVYTKGTADDPIVLDGIATAGQLLNSLKPAQNRDFKNGG